MSEITLIFETEEQKEHFLGWFLDGGGEYEFCSSMISHDLGPVATNFDETSISFHGYDEEE